MEDLSGQVIKGYKLDTLIGSGGFGAVYKARQTSVDREVAIKVILPAYANKPDFIRRFEIEAQLVARLEHPHIVPLHDYWRDPNGAYLVMRYLRQGSLQVALDKSPFDPQSAVQLIDQVTSALELAHRNSIIHRDIKPANILLDEDKNAYLADFGIAKILDETTGDIEKDGLIGSLDYISPEQARKEPVTPRTDIYNLGVVIYEILTGQHPYPDASSMERLYKHLSEPLPDIEIGEESFQEHVNAIIQKATAKKPKERYSNVLELAKVFRDAVGVSLSSKNNEIVENLTLREQEVLGFIVVGLSNREIADKLVIALSTVKWYINQIYHKLGVRGRVQAIMKAGELNLVNPVSRVDGELKYKKSVSTISLPAQENPYRGLRPFLSTDYRFFFGRENLVERLIQRMSDQDSEISHRFLAILGPSGSGKSSIVRAGLIPALWRGNLPGSERWFVVDLLPGAQPINELETALLQVAGYQTPKLREYLHLEKAGLQRAAELILPKDDSELVIIVDQFEEVFTLVEDEKIRTHFLNLIYSAVTEPNSRVRVVLTLRADFYDRPLHYPEFGELLRNRMETVLPLSADELEQAIRRPAELVGVTFETGLVPTIIEDIHNQSGALPLLQYALTELFDNRTGRMMTKEAYKEMDGAIGALATRAEDIFEHLNPDGKSLARQMFLRLVTLGEGIEDTRRRVAYAELLALVEETSIDLMEDVIDTFTNYRLLSLDNDPGTRTPTVEVAHEAILREWDRYSCWLDESRSDIREQRILSGAASEWVDSDRDESFLLHGTRLGYYESWVTETDLTLTSHERSFLEASLNARRLREEEEAARQAHEARLEQRSRRFLWALVGVFALATVIAVILSLVASNQSNIAQDNAATATFAQGEALNLADSRATQQAIAESEAKARATQQEIAVVEANARATQQIIAENEAEQRAAAESVAQDNLNLARANELGNVSLNLKEKRPDLAFLLSVEAYNQAGTLHNWTAMYDVGTHNPQLQSVLHGHLGRVQALTYSPDGKILASGGLDGTVLLWDLQPDSDTYGHSIELLRDSALPPIESVAFSPDGNLLAASTADGRVLAGSPHQINHVMIWDTDSNSPTYLQLLKHQITNEFVYLRSGVAFHPNRPILAVAKTGMIELLDVDRDSQNFGERLGTLGDSPYFGGVGFSPDGEILVGGICYVDSGVVLWRFIPDDPSASEEITKLAPPFVFCAGSGFFSPDGKRLVNGFASLDLLTWDLDPESPTFGKPLVTLTGHDWLPGHYAISRDGKRLASTGGFDESARIWDFDPDSATFGEQLGSPLMHGHVVDSVTFDKDGETLAVGVSTGSIYLWDLTQKALEEMAHSWETWGAIKLAAQPETEYAHPLETILTGHTGVIESVAFSPDGMYLASASGGTDAWGEGEVDGTIRLWDVDPNSPTFGQQVGAPFDNHGTWAAYLAYDPTGTRLASAHGDGSVRLWDVNPSSPTFGQPLSEPLFGNKSDYENPYFFIKVAFSPDGRYLTSSGIDRVVNFWDVNPDSPTYSQLLLDEPDWNVFADDVVFSPDGKFLATAGLGFENHAIDVYEPTQLWDADPESASFGKLVIELEGGHWGRINRLKFHPNGKVLASASQDGTIILWDVNPYSNTFGQLIGTPLLTDGHDVSGIAFSPDGKLLISVNAEGGKVQLWDVDLNSPNFGQPLGVPLNQEDILAMIVEYSPDGKTIAVGDFFHRIHLWNVDPRAWIDYVCKRANRNLTKEEWDLYLSWAGPYDPDYKSCPQWP